MNEKPDSKKLLNICRDLSDIVVEPYDHIPLTDIKIIKDSTTTNNECESDNKKSYKTIVLEKEKEDNVKKWTISNCEDVSVALNFFDSKNLAEELQTSTNILLIKFEIDENFTDLNTRETWDLSTKCRKKNILIILQSKEDGKVFIFWKSKDIDNLLSLKSYNEVVLNDQILLHDFIVKFLLKSLNDGHLGLHSCYSHLNNASKIELHILADTRGYNLLLIAAELGEAAVANILLNSGLSPYLQDSSISAQSLALAAGHFNVILLFLNSNLTFPSSMNISKCPNEIKEFCEITQQLHKAILAKNGDKVKEIVCQNKHLRHFYTIANESATKIALANKLIDMYEILLVNKVLFGPHENITAVMDKLNYEEKRHLRDVHFKNSIDMPEKHINTIMANSYVGHEEVTNVQEKIDLVKNAFRFLNENPFIKIILMVVAASRQFQIIFDFNRSSVNFIDPTSDSYTEGLFYLSGRIYIGAKQLLDDATKYETFATMAHELCHYAMFLVFNNEANPYPKDDEQGKQEIDEISKQCQEHSGKEEIVDLVYECYPEDMHHAELIVRPVHMMAFYHDQPEKLQECRNMFSRLFNIYEGKIVVAMQKALPNIEKRNEREIAKKDKKISSLRRYLFILISILILLLVGAGIISYIILTTSYLYKDLSDEDKATVQNTIVNYANIDLKFHELFPIESKAYEDLQPDHVKQILKHQTTKLNLTENQYVYLSLLVSFNWTTLSDVLVNRFLDFSGNFQSEILKFEDIYQNYTEAFDSLSSREIDQVLKNQTLYIGEPFKSEVKFYIERSFINENIGIVYHDYKEQNNVDSSTFEEYYLNTLNENSYIKDDYLEGIVNSNSFKINPHVCALNSDEMKFAHIEFNETFERVKDDRIFILSAEAGTGKTVTFEKLAEFIKHKYPMSWVSYIDLRKYSAYYDKNSDVEDVENLFVNIFNFTSENEFEWNIFHKAYIEGNAVFIWNGFDEISPTYNGFILSVLRSIYSDSENVQFICTRPSYSKQLRNEFEKDSYVLVPFDKKKQIEFLKSYILTDDDNTIQKVLTIIEKLEDKSVKNSNDFNTPLMLQMIADTREDVKVLESGNVYKIYESYFRTKIEIWKKRSQSSDNFTINALTGNVNLNKILQIFAIRYEMSELSSVVHLKLPRLDIFDNKYIAQISQDNEIAKMGILSIDTRGNLQLAHKTFAEFLMTNYLIENIYDVSGCMGENDAELRLELFFYIAQVYGQNQWLITEYLKYYLLDQTTDEEKFNREISKSIESKFKMAFVDLLRTKHPEIFEFLINFFKKDKFVLKELLRINDDETFYTAIFNPIHNAHSINPSKIINIVKDSKVLSDHEFNKFLNGKNQSATILIGLYYYRDSEVPKVHEIEKRSFYTDSNFTDFLETLEEDQLSDVLMSPAISAVFLEYITDNIEEVDDILWSKLKIMPDNVKESFFGNSIERYLETFKNPEDESILKFLLKKSEEFMTIKKIIVDRYLLHKSGRHFKTLWNYIVQNGTKNETQKDILKQFHSGMYVNFGIIESDINRYYDRTKFLIFHTALLNADSDASTKYVINAYENVFDANEMRQMIQSSTDFFLYFASYANKQVCDEFTSYLVKLFKTNGNDFQDFLDQINQKLGMSLVKYMEYFRKDSYCGVSLDNIPKKIEDSNKKRCRRYARPIDPNLLKALVGGGIGGYSGNRNIC